jgi:type I restriction enzyme S subunit
MKNSTNGWQRYSLEELSETINYGLTASAVHREDGPRFLRITDIQDNTVKWASVPSCNASRNELVQCQLQAGDIVFARTGATTGKSFLIRNCPNEAVFASYLIRVRPGNRINPVYLSHYFNTPEYWAQIQKEAQGAGQPGVNSTKLKTLSIPLPPLPEQRRIADILDKADAIRRKRRNVPSVRELIKSIFFDFFGDPFAASQGTNSVTFGQLTSRITYGFTCPMDHIETGIPIITGKNIRDGYIDFHNVDYARHDQFDALTAKSKPIKGDILIIKDGAIRGRCAILDKATPICINQSVALVQPNHDHVTSEFLYGYLSSTVVRRKIDSMDKGVAMPHLQITELAKFPVKLPPLKEQQRFSKVYRQALTLSNRVAESTLGIDNLFNSLVQQAFRGEL